MCLNKGMCLKNPLNKTALCLYLIILVSQFKVFKSSILGEKQQKWTICMCDPRHLGREPVYLKYDMEIGPL